MLLFTLIQLSKDTHIIFSYGNNDNNDKLVVFATLYTTKIDDFREFLKTNKQYVESSDEPKGFGARIKNDIISKKGF